ncbi:protein takeout-like [Aethina tumida]|uniref:protein takeout-like n=1 Tax=Aethina tumida TaxID=116153 RepID=UPI0021474E62|nr:protein takeout-like [Aethina tumida]
MVTLWLYSLLFVVGVYGLPPPSYLKPCSIKNNFDKCAFVNGQAAIPFLLKGDKKYGIPVIEPFTLSLLEISPGDNLKIVFRNLTGIGLDKAKLRAVKYDANKNHMKILTDLPSLKILGDYDAKGRILVLPIEGKGPFEIEAIDGKYTYSFDIIPHEKKGEIYGSIENGDLDFDIKNVKLNFENLFNGDKTLGSQMNMFLNENWRDVFKDLKGAISKSFGAICKTVLQNYFSRIPLKELILE